MGKIYLCLFVFAAYFSSQGAVVNFNQQTFSTLQDSSKIKGTYQIQMVNTRDLPSIPYNLEQMVEEKRDKDKVVYIKLSDFVRVKVLPKSEIEKKDFKPVKHIEYVTE